MRILLLIVFTIVIILAIETPCTQSVPIGPIIGAGARAAGPAIKQVFHKFATRKAAKEAAQKASKGVKPISHGPHKPGYSPHYHQTGKNGKPTDYTIKRPAGSDKSFRVHEHFQFPKKQG